MLHGNAHRLGVSPKIMLPIEGYPPRPTNEEKIIAHEHARDMPDSLEIIRSCIHIADEALGQDLTNKELLEALRQVRSMCLPTLTYFITR